MTKRQATLLDWLVTFCERCGSPDLPVRVTRVIGYGSYFRGKDRPSDVDLLAITGEDHPLFDRFRAIVEKRLCRGHKALPPADHFRSMAAAEPDLAESDAAGIIARWPDGFSDAMLYEHRSFVDELFAPHPERFARRMLHAGLPGIRARLDREDSEPTSKGTYEVRTPGRPDVRTNVERIWTSDRRNDLIAELRSFQERSRPFLIQIAILNRIANRLARSRIGVIDQEIDGTRDRYDDWLRSQDFGFDAKLCVEATDRLLDRYSCEGQPDPPRFELLAYEALVTDELARLVEERRQRLKIFYDRAFVLRISTNYLALWCFFDKRHSKLRRWDYVMTKVTDSIPVREVKARTVSEILDAESKRLGPT